MHTLNYITLHYITYIHILHTLHTFHALHSLHTLHEFHGSYTPPPPEPPPEITGWEMSWLFETTFRKVGLNKEPKHHSDVRFDLCFFRILLQLTEAPTEPLLKPY